jgi:hypothetical protein
MGSLNSCVLHPSLACPWLVFRLSVAGLRKDDNLLFLSYCRLSFRLSFTRLLAVLHLAQTPMMYAAMGDERTLQKTDYLPLQGRYDSVQIRIY